MFPGVSRAAVAPSLRTFAHVLNVLIKPSKLLHFHCFSLFTLRQLSTKYGIFDLLGVFEAYR